MHLPDRKRNDDMRLIWVPLILFVGLCALGAAWRRTHTAQEGLDAAISLLPILPGIFLALGVIQRLRALDELKRKIAYESVAVSFVLTLLLALSLGMLGLAGLAQPNDILIALFMGVVLALAKYFITRKYQ